MDSVIFFLAEGFVLMNRLALCSRSFLEEVRISRNCVSVPVVLSFEVDMSDEGSSSNGSLTEGAEEIIVSKYKISILKLFK